MILGEYLFWHYGLALRQKLYSSLTLLRTTANFFSILPLAKSILAPWHRIKDPYQRGFEFGEFFWTLASNLISRILGAIVRLVVIAAGLAALVLVLVWCAAVLMLWLLGPLLSPLAILVGALFILT